MRLSSFKPSGFGLSLVRFGFGSFVLASAIGVVALAFYIASAQVGPLSSTSENSFAVMRDEQVCGLPPGAGLSGGALLSAGRSKLAAAVSIGGTAAMTVLGISLLARRRDR